MHPLIIVEVILLCQVTLPDIEGKHSYFTAFSDLELMMMFLVLDFLLCYINQGHLHTS